MRTKRVLRYYCDHCNKGGCGKAAMLRHERRCIKNPQRKCGFCGEIGAVQQPMEELLKAFEDGGLAKLREVTDNCPACILSTIVQSRMNDKYPEDSSWVEFDYKKEVSEHWERKRQEFEDMVGVQDKEVVF